MLTYKRLLAGLIAVFLLLGTLACSVGQGNDISGDESVSEESFSVEPSSDIESITSAESIDSTSADNTESESSESKELSESTEISTDSSDDKSVESSEELSSSEPTDSTDISVESADDSSESAEDSYEKKLAASFVQYADPVSYTLSWENNGLELYNTDFRMSEELEEKLKRRLSSFSNAQSVMLIELDTNMAFAFSKDTKIATASAIKGPMALYVNKCVDAGIITWDSTLAYQKRHFQEHSTGVIQKYDFGTKFRASRLIDFMISISDNQAYLMLKEMVKGSNFNKMMATLGCSQIIPNGANWGYITAAEMAAAWREIYYYSLETQSGAKLFDRFMKALYNYIYSAIPQYESAHKSGWSSKAFNDAGVVFADGHEYVLVVLCGRSSIEDQRSQAHFTAVTKLLAELMVEYNAYLDGESGSESAETSTEISDESANSESSEAETSSEIEESSADEITQSDEVQA